MTEGTSQSVFIVVTVPTDESDFVFDGKDTIICYKGNSNEITTINGASFNNIT